VCHPTSVPLPIAFIDSIASVKKISRTILRKGGSFAYNGHKCIIVESTKSAQYQKSCWECEDVLMCYSGMFSEALQFN